MNRVWLYIALMAFFGFPWVAFAQGGSGDASEQQGTVEPARLSVGSAIETATESTKIALPAPIVDSYLPKPAKLTGAVTTLEAKQPPKEARPDVSNQAELAREKQDALLIGKPVGKVSFECDMQICDNPANTREFKELMGIEVGDIYSSKKLAVGLERLAKTGFFSKLRVGKQLVGGFVFLVVSADGSTLIREVRFEGLATPPFESDLRKITIYRQGQAYRKVAQKAHTQLASFRSLYEREGYFGTKIELFVKPVGESNQLVDLVFKIERGEPRKICEVGLRGVKAMPYVEAREWLLSDGSFFSRRLNLYETTYTTRGFKRGQQELIEEYRRQGYFQARIVRKLAKFSKTSSCVTLIVDVAEGPHWDLRFIGSKRFLKEDLVEKLPFFETGYVDSEEIRRAEYAIAKLYETRGYPFAKIAAREVRRDRLDRILEFQIEEGPQLEIQEIKFHGNTVFTSAEFLEVMGTRVFALFDVGGYLQTDQLLGDFVRIENLYKGKGYVRASVERFELEVLPGGDALRVNVFLSEGEPTKVSRVDIDGNRILPDGSLLDGLNSLKGTPFFPLSVKADQTRIVQKYASLGHPLAQVQSACLLLTGEQVACEAPRRPKGCVSRTTDELTGRCSWSDDKTRFSCNRILASEDCKFEGGVQYHLEMRIHHEVKEGPVVRVGPRLLKGNFETRSSVIHREIPLRRGDLLDTQKLIAGQGNLRQLNVLNSVSIETIGLDEEVYDLESTDAALLVSVEEAPTSYIDFKFGFELREPFVDSRQLLLTGEAQYTNRNLFGLAQGIQPRVIGSIDTLQIFESGAEKIDYLFGAELLYSHPRFLKDFIGIERLYFTLGPFYLLDLLGVVDSQILREEWGVRADFRKDLSELLDRLFFKLGVEFKQVATFEADDPIINGERIFSPRQTRGKLEPDFAYDQRDSPLNPTSGYLLRLQPALVSGDAFGQGGEGFLQDSFLRLESSASYFFPFWRGIVVLAQSIKYGQTFALAGRETAVPVDERFFLGGVRSVRGFQEGSLGPVSDNQVPTGGEFFLNYSAELRYPILGQFSIFGAAFFDSGLLTSCFDEEGNRDCFDEAFGAGPFETTRASAGLGLRILIFDQLPIVFDYGIVLNRRPGEAYGQVHLNVGYTFD